jgi:ribosome-binding ATPase YchF (GTP1/OBG family)
MDPTAPIRIEPQPLTVQQELRTKDHEFLESRHEALKKMVNRGLDKQQKEEMAMLEKFIEYMAPLDKCIRHGEWSANEIDFLNTLQVRRVSSESE